MTDLSREVLKNVYGISSVKQSFPVHYYALVNVEGVVYYLDFAFNQFVEDSVTTHYGIPQGTGETTGIIVMPLGVDNGFIEELPEGEISVTDHTPPALTAVVSEPYEWGTTASTGDYIVYYTSETIGQIPIIGRPITEGVDIIVGGIEAVGDAAAYVWDFVLGKDEYSGEHTQLDSRGGGSIDSSYFAATTSENSYPDPTQNSALVHAVEVSSEHSDGNHISPDDIDPSPGWIGETWGSFKKWIVSLNEYPEGWLKTPYLTDRRYSPPGGLLREIPIDRSPRLCGDFYHEGNCLTNPNCIFAYGRITLPLCLPIRATGVRFFCEDIEDLESCQRVPNCVYLSGVGCVSSEYLGEDDCYMLNEEECTNKVERINGLCKRNLVRDSRGSWQSGFSAEEPWYCEPNPIDPYDPKTTDPNYYNPDQISTAIWDYDGPVSSDNYCFDVWDGNYCSGAYLLKCYGTQIGDRIYCENGCKHVPVQVGEGGNDRCNEAPKYTDGCRDRQSKGFYCHEGDKILCTDPIRPSVLGFKFFSDYYAQEKFRTYCILGCEYGKCNIGMSSMQQYCDPDSEYYKGADEFCLDDHYLTRCEERDNGGYIMPQTYCRYGCDDDGKCLTVWSGACNGKADGEYCAWNKLITCENGIAVDSDYCDKGCVEGACA